MNRYAVPISVALSIVALALGLWVWSIVASMRFVESVTKFDIPFGTKMIERRHESTRLGADSFRIIIYELNSGYAGDIYGRCESLGYLRLTREQAGYKFPALDEYLVSDVPVCARRDRGEALTISIIQGNRVIVLVSH